MSQTILVTGASSGFGLLIAHKLHNSGYTIIGTRGTSVLINLQHFAYGVLEKNVLKQLNSF